MESTIALLQRHKSKNNKHQQLAALQQKAEQLIDSKNPGKAMPYFEQCAQLKISVFGDDSLEFSQYLKRVFDKCKRVSLQLIDSGSYEQALMILKRLKNLVALPSDAYTYIKQKWDIYNTFAWVYRSTKKYKVAIQFLTKALQLEKLFPNEDLDLANTHIQLCAIYSAVDKHSRALKHGIQAVSWAQEDLVNLKLEGEDYSDKITSLGVAYHNWGIEEEKLGNKESALRWFQKAVKFMDRQRYTNKSHGRLHSIFSASFSELNTKQKRKSASRLQIRRNKDNLSQSVSAVALEIESNTRKLPRFIESPIVRQESNESFQQNILGTQSSMSLKKRQRKPLYSKRRVIKQRNENQMHQTFDFTKFKRLESTESIDLDVFSPVPHYSQIISESEDGLGKLKLEDLSINEQIESIQSSKSSSNSEVNLGFSQPHLFKRSTQPIILSTEKTVPKRINSVQMPKETSYSQMDTEEFPCEWPRCSMLFDQHMHVPRVIDCGHLLCTSCIEGFLGHQIKCDICGSSSKISNRRSYPVDASQLDGSPYKGTSQQHLIFESSIDREVQYNESSVSIRSEYSVQIEVNSQEIYDSTREQTQEEKIEIASRFLHRLYARMWISFAQGRKQQRFVAEKFINRLWAVKWITFCTAYGNWQFDDNTEKDRQIMKKLTSLSSNFMLKQILADFKEFHQAWEAKRVWAAIRIQSSLRADYQRKRFVKVRDCRRKWAKKTIHKNLEAFVKRRKEQKQEEETQELAQLMAATKMQRFYRRKLTLKAEENARHELEMERKATKVQRYYRAQKDKSSLLQRMESLKNMVKMEERFAKILNEVKYIVTIYSKPGEQLVVAYEDLSNEKTLLLTDVVTVDEIKENLEIENDLLVLNNEKLGRKIVFMQQNSFNSAKCVILMNEDDLFIDFTSTETSCSKKVPLADVQNAFNSPDWPIRLYLNISVLDEAIVVTYDSSLYQNDSFKLQDWIDLSLKPIQPQKTTNLQQSGQLAAWMRADSCERLQSPAPSSVTSSEQNQKEELYKLDLPSDEEEANSSDSGSLQDSLPGNSSYYVTIIPEEETYKPSPEPEIGIPPLDSTGKFLLMRSGVQMLKKLFVVSIFRTSEGFMIEAENSASGPPLILNQTYNTKDMANSKEFDEYWNDLLIKLKIIKDSTGSLELTLAEDPLNPTDLSQVIYKKPHYISNRYFLVSIYRSNIGLTLQAYEPEKGNTLDLLINKNQHFEESETTKDELSKLISCLAVSDVMGEETLVYAGNATVD